MPLTLTAKVLNETPIAESSSNLVLIEAILVLKDLAKVPVVTAHEAKVPAAKAPAAKAPAAKALLVKASVAKAPAAKAPAA